MTFGAQAQHTQPSLTLSLPIKSLSASVLSDLSRFYELNSDENKMDAVSRMQPLGGASTALFDNWADSHFGPSVVVIFFFTYSCLINSRCPPSVVIIPDI